MLYSCMGPSILPSQLEVLFHGPNWLRNKLTCCGGKRFVLVSTSVALEVALMWHSAVFLLTLLAQHYDLTAHPLTT